MITMTELHNLFDYNTSTGDLIWKNHHGKRKVKGKVAGTLHPRGYVKAVIGGRAYMAHRLIWIYHGKELTKPFINHINGIRNDNRIENLEVVTNRENHQKRKIHLEGKLVGACFDKNSRKWISSIYLNKKNIYIGSFATEQEAHENYNKLLMKEIL